MIGGVGFVFGTINGAIVAPGALLSLIGLHWQGFVTWLPIIGGAGALLAVRFNPNGIASQQVRDMGKLAGKLGAKLGLRSRAHAWTELEMTAADAPIRVAPQRLRVEGLTVRYGGVLAVDGVSIDAAPGEVVGLIGPNGAGKTSLMDAVSGFTPYQGRVLLEGQRVDSWPSHRRSVAGLVRSFQGLELFSEMTILENLQVPHDRLGGWGTVAELLRPARTTLPPVTIAAVKEFGLEPVLHKLPDEISYGQRRLVAIARAVAAEPSVLLLDEPVAGLSEHESAEFARLVRRLADVWGMAVLVIEHDLNFVMSICDRITVIDFGRPVCEGAPDEVRRDPRRDRRLPRRGDRGPERGVGARAAGDPVTALIEARQISAGYGGVEIVRDLSLEVHAGEVVALLGANGAGKTTTLLTLAGELAPLDGEVLMDGERTTAPLYRRARKGMAFVTEERSIFPKLTTRQNLAVARADIEQATALFPELVPLMSRRSALLSGGEAQMLTLSRALARAPSLLLADELSLGLAPKTVGRLLRAVREAADRGIGALLVEQHVHRVLEVADRVYLLQQGRVRFAGTAADARGSIDEIQATYLTAPAVARQ